MKHIDLTLSSIANKVLNEDYVQLKKQYSDDYQGIVNKCIDRVLFLNVNYDDRKGDKGTKLNPATGKPWGNPRGRRKILPFAFYKSRLNGEDTIRAIHWNSTNTKRGPGKWKEFTLSQFKFLQESRKHFTIEDILPDANWDGDDHAAELYNIVKKENFEKSDFELSHETKFLSPLEREKMRFSNDKKGFSSDELYTNQEGPVKQALPNVKKGRNVSNLANLNVKLKAPEGETPEQMTKRPNYDFKAAKKNMQDFNAHNSNDMRMQKFADWDRAKAEADRQTQRSRPVTPVQNDSGPVNTRRNVNNNEDEENWDEYLNRPNNNNF